MSKIKIYTDGAARGNPGPGGYGIILEYKSYTKEISEGFRLTTNNRMELLAVIVGLESITEKGQDILIVSDSKYVVDSVNQGWVFNWEKQGYKKKKNPDLWRRFLKIYKHHNILFRWVKGHAGHYKNERCDELAVHASHLEDLKIDEGYELSQNTQKGFFD